MQSLVDSFGEALKWIDGYGEPFKNFRPGVGPYGEPQLLKLIVTYLSEEYPDKFGRAQTKRMPDILIPNQWALEIKIVRPFGDNGREAEHWSQNLLHPYEGNVSSIGDALKLQKSNFKERKGIVVITYQYNPQRLDLQILIDSFESIAKKVLGLPLSDCYVSRVTNLKHPVHQQSIIYGWELHSE
jgi:hypothetical protein